VIVQAPRLVVITDTSVSAVPELIVRVERVLASAAPRTVMVQLRDKELEARDRLELGKRLVAVCRRLNQWFVVNDRLDLALLLEADGVHLGEGSVAPADARTMLPDRAWVSIACHEPEAVGRPDADAVLLSPVVAGRKGREALGFEGLRSARRKLVSSVAGTAPALYALGGIDAGSARECLAAGADGVAVIGAVLDGRDPRPLLDALRISSLSGPLSTP
jgi:thiamine-phosphate pyrophosphorylase